MKVKRLSKNRVQVNEKVIFVRTCKSDEEDFNFHNVKIYKKCFGAEIDINCTKTTLRVINFLNEEGIKQ